jgi:hypothetical protein
VEDSLIYEVCWMQGRYFIVVYNDCENSIALEKTPPKSE